jgi:hypothetical protein
MPALHPNLDFDPSAVISSYFTSVQESYQISSSQQFLKVLFVVAFILVFFIGVQLLFIKGRDRGRDRRNRRSGSSISSSHDHRD